MSAQRPILPLLCLLGLLVAPCAPAAGTAAGERIAYRILFAGEPSGELDSTWDGRGGVRTHFSYRDNGRGPDLDETLQLDADGTPLRYEVRGRSTFGAPVEERYRRRGTHAEWRSTSDRGAAVLHGPAFYLPVERSFEIDALVARALLLQPAHALAALPGGQLAISRRLTATLEDGARRIEVGLYAITGWTLQPRLVWLREDATHRLFAWTTDSYVHLIDADWADQYRRIDELQQQSEHDWYRELAQRTAHRPQGPLLIRNVRVFDAEQAVLGAASDVYVSEGRIAAVLPAGALGAAAQARTVVDGTGRVLLPGLYDMHAHEEALGSVLQVAGGVTTSRDLANVNDFLAAHRARIAAGETVGPRIIANGFIEGRSPYSTRGGFVVDSLDKAREAVDWYAARGFRQLKLYNSFRPEWVQPLAEYAHTRGLRVGGHVPAFMRAEEAVRAGYDELHHVNQVLLNFLVRPGDDTRTLVRFYRVADGAATLDLNSPAVLDFVKLLRERGTVVDPTLTVHEDMFTHRQGTVDPSYAAVFEHVPVELQRNWRRNSMNVNAGNAGLYRLSYDQIAAFVAQLHRAGVPLVAGTDDISGFTLHRELELYVQAGIPANEVLRIATWNGAKYTQTLADSGSVTPGKRADLVLVEGNPLEDISAIRRISMVVQDGAVYFPAELYEALGVRRFVDPPALASVPAPAG
ncbi:MAG: amidohydrolase family protein [Steroidobacteraceae bacterium]